MTTKNLLLAVPAALFLHACSSDSNHDFQPGIDEQAEIVNAGSGAQANFDPTNGVLPFPTDILAAPSANGANNDGTLNIPVADPSDLSNPQVALNQMDGFSTISPIVTSMNRNLDQTSIGIGTSVRIFAVTRNATGGFDTTGELGADTIAGIAGPNSLVLLPVRPLPPQVTYLVVLTNALTDEGGEPLARSRTYRLLAGDTDFSAPQTSALQGEVRRQLAAAEAAGITKSDVVLSWTFSTQSTRNTLQAVKDAAVPEQFNLRRFGTSTTADFIPGLPGKADIWTGTLQVPYYLTAPAEGADADPTVALNSFWTGTDNSFLTGDNPMPEETSKQTIPVLITVPNATAAGTGEMPAAGWPVAIFQHGITQNRTNTLALANTMADAGFATVAIDMPMHGLPSSSPLSAAMSVFPGDRERTFDIDVLTQSADGPTTPGPDGTPDSSGSHFYQLTNLANSRDNLRQAAADLFVLSASLGSVTKDNNDDPNIQFDVSRKAFIGHSLGGIVGGVFISYDTSLTSATLAMPGSGIAQLLTNSQSFGPTILAGLAAAGIEPGSAAFNQFLVATQTVIDSGDPVNHAAFAAQNGPPIHFIEVIGDTTVPNAIPLEDALAPLSGSEPMALLLGLQPVTATTEDGNGGLVRFTAGDHGSILNPAASVPATLEMQRQTATFAATNGGTLLISDPSVIQGAAQ